MPTSSSARLSGPAASSAGSQTKTSGRRSSSNGGSGKPSTKPSAKSNNHDDDASVRPPLATAEILEKATLPLSALSARDALTVWKALGLYLGEQLTQKRRVVAVDHLGVFGANDAGEAVFLHNPVFLQSNRLKESVPRHALKGQPALAASAMSKVNAQEISQEYLQNCGRDVVDQVVAHVVAFVGKAAKQGRALRLSVLPLGEWVCTDATAEFKFLPEFQQQMVATSKPPRGPPAKPGKESRTPDEMRERGRGAHTQERGDGDLRAAEPTLTAEALEDHTKHAGVKSQPIHKDKSLPSRSTNTSGSRRVGWSEPETTNGSTPSMRRSTSRAKPRKTDKTKKPPPTPERSNDAEPTGVVGRVRAKLLERCGERGLNALQRVLSLLDTSGDGVLSAQELKFGLRDLGIELSAKELHQVVAYFDRNGDGVVSLDELLTKLRGKLSGPRRGLIERAFDCMDRERRGVVSLEDLRDNYDVSLLPRVRAGKKTKVQAMNEFLREWETSVEHNNGIPREAFVEYYHNVSACVPDDSDFELLMKHTWHVSLPESDSELSGGEDDEQVVQASAPISAPSRLREEAHGRSPQGDSSASSHSDEWTYLRSVVLPPRVGVHSQPTLDDVCRRLGVNRVWGDGNETMNSRAFANALVKLDRSLHSKDAQHLAALVGQCCGDTRAPGGGDVISLAAVFQVLVGSNPVLAPAGQSGTSAVSIVDRIRARLLQRLQVQTRDAGETVVPTFVGLNALQRTLRLLDSNGDKRLSKDELKAGLRKIGVDVNFHELDQLFTCLDADRSGCIDMDEFLVAMRGGDEALTNNTRRLALVHKAFDLLDRDRDGSVTLEELSRAYDTSKHPDVLAGRMTAQEALRQFAQQWDTLDKDGVITRREFEVYYRNVSAVIDSDNYFELMMRNAWHISGGAGQYANSSNRRVLVTKADGSQSVEEVKNDLGIRASDRDKIHANLRAQGIEPSEFATSGYVEDKKKPAVSAKKETTTTDRPWRRAQAENDRPDSRSTKPSTYPPSKGGVTARATQGKDASRSSNTRTVAPSDFFGSSTATDAGPDAVHARRQQQRQLRERAALLIQAQFRGFKCRKFVDCVRRQMAAEAQRRQREESEQAPRRRVVTRAALKSYYGF